MTDAEKIAAVIAYIETREHRDDWGVPCIYTNGLREILDMPASQL